MSAALKDTEVASLFGVEQEPPAPKLWQDQYIEPPNKDFAPPIAGVRFKAQPHVNTKDLDADFVSRVNRLYEAMPAQLRDQDGLISSGVRTWEQQAAARARMENGTGGLAAQPGQSRHQAERGAAAMDFSSGPALKWLHSDEGKRALAGVGLEMPFAAKGDPGHMQMAGPAQKADGVTAARQGDNKALSNEQVVALFSGATKGETEKTPSPGFFERISKGLEEAPGVVGPLGPIATGDAAIDFGEANAAALNGVRRGLQNTVLGLAQTVAPRSVMEPVEEKVRQFESQFDELTEKHPNYDFAGKIVGGTMGIMLGAKLLGAAGAATMPAMMTRGVTAVWNWLGPVGRGVATGPALAATSYYEKGPEDEKRPFGLPAREFDTVMYSTFGAAGGLIARGVQWGATALARGGTAARQEAAEKALESASGALQAQGRELQQKFTQTLQETANGITRNTEQPLNEALAHYERVEKVGATKYQLRNAAGRSFEGFPSGVGASEEGAVAESGFKQAIDTSLEQSRTAGVETRRAVETVAGRVRQVLGLNTEEGRLAEWKAQQEIFKEQMATAQEARAKLAPNFPPRPGQDPAERAVNEAAYFRQQELMGNVPPLPTPPAPFEPRPVSPEAYAQARTAINGALRRTRDTAGRTQLKMMLSSIDDVAKGVGAEYGLGGEEFLRRASQANKFFEENVAPLRNLFGGKTAAEVRGRANVPLEGMTPAQFYDKIATAVGKDDLKQIGDLARVLGPRGRENMKMIAASEAIFAGERSGAGTIKYVREHEAGLRELLGREEYQQLVGLANIAEHVQKSKPYVAPSQAAGKKDTAPNVWRWGHSIGPAFGFYQLGHALVSLATGSGGATRHLAEAAVMFGAVPMSHFAFNVTRRIHEVPVTKFLVRRAAELEPGSKELDEVLKSIERRVRAATIVGSRAAQP